MQQLLNCVDRRPTSWTPETALTVLVKSVFPDLPDELAARTIPAVESFNDDQLGSKVPWNRRTRRRLEGARHLVLHLFSGKDQRYWTRQLQGDGVEILCVDLLDTCGANVLDDATYTYLLRLAMTGRLRAIIGGPPCRTVSALRFQQDGGPRVVRDETHPYGMPTNTYEEQVMVTGDSVLWLRMMVLHIVAEEMREEDSTPTAFVMEQPEDPKEYRSDSDIQRRGYMSMWRTKEWKSFAARYNMRLVSFDQGRLGHPKKKPTTLGTNNTDLEALHDMRGEGTGPPMNRQDMTLKERCAESRTWSEWAPGLKHVLALVIRRWTAQPHPRPDGSPRMNRLSPWTMEQWKRHVLQDHQPARRDCRFCVQAQARSRAHQRVRHAEAFTLAVDLSGRMTEGLDQCTQGTRKAKYMMVGVYTFPTTTKGVPLVQSPGEEDPVDQQLPPLDVTFDQETGLQLDMDDPEDPPRADVPEDAEVNLEPPGEDAPGGEDPLQEMDEPPTLLPSNAETHAKTAHETWTKLITEAKDVQVKNLTLVEPLESRAVHHVLPALAKMYGRLRSLGLPVYRLHTDRARELLSNQIKRWTLDRGIVSTLTSGSSFKQNGRAENEVNQVKRGVRTLVGAGRCSLEHWPLAARHVGERRLRSQLDQLGWPTKPLLPFGAQAFAYKKSWQDRYQDWRECREPVTILGPDASSSLTTNCYYVKANASGRFFYTDDVIEVDPVTHDLQLPPPDEINLPIRGEHPLQPSWGEIPTRRLRGKQALPQVAMLDIAGEDRLLDDVLLPLGEAVSGEDHTPGSDSWTLGTREDSDRSLGSWEVEDRIGGGEKEGAPNNREGGSCPVASFCIADPTLSLQYQQANLHHYIQDELERIDGTQMEQAWCMEAINEAIMKKAHIEEVLLAQMRDDLNEPVINENQEGDFNITKTISNKEVWDNLELWRPSVEKEYNQLVIEKKAVRQMKRQDLNHLAAEKNLPIELLPGKSVHVRKAGSGKYKTRAVVCGNYASSDGLDHFASGSDAVMVRALIRCAAQKRWSLAGTDIGVAFLNAPKRDQTKLTAMEIPSIFKRCKLAEPDEVWLIDMAVYGLTTSPRDWSLHRDETLPTIKWQRQTSCGELQGYFQQTKDENLWRLCERNIATGETIWSGLMSVYVDDLLLAADREVIDAALEAVSQVWTLSPTEWASEDHALTYCGFEIAADGAGDGYLVSQFKYQNEMLLKWGIQEESKFPDFRISEEDHVKSEVVDPEMIRRAQAISGCLLWLSTRTRPDLAFGVASMSRLTTYNPTKAVEIGMALLRYVKGNRGGMRYPAGIPNPEWGARGHLKDKRDHRTLEIFADIAYAAGSNHRSIQGFVVYHAGVPIAWQCCQQPFAAHSTAESELISYCEGLLIGKATEALLLEMWKMELGDVGFNNVLYGDNEAALGLGKGVSSCSWRTRHLRIRGTVIKESLIENHRGPGNGWKVLHMKGTELVADGMTKPLRFQAFDRFLEDLGLAVSQENEKPVEQNRPSVDVMNAAKLAILIGSSMMVGVDATNDADDLHRDEGFDYMDLCGPCLMMIGMAFVIKCIVQAMGGCLKWLVASPNDTGEVIVVDVDSENEEKSEETRPSNTRQTMKGQSGLGNEGTVSRTSSMRSGTADDGTMSTKSMRQSGGSATSNRMRPQSGLDDACAVAAPVSRDDNDEDFGARHDDSSATRKSSATTVSETIVNTGTATSSTTQPADERSREVGPYRRRNPWNEFQQSHKGKGLNSTTLSKMYKEYKGATGTP
eukprot:Skav200865  [mRNA]  locus=scaffold3214:128100:133379:+ [translate_table: standard]